MPTEKAIIRQISAAWLAPCLDATAGMISSTSVAIDSLGTNLKFDYIADAGPEWPAPEGSTTTEYIEALAANGNTVQYVKNVAKVDGVTGDVKDPSATGGAAHKLKFTILEWGKTLATTLPGMLGKLVVCCIPIGENVTSSEDGWYYLCGKLSGAITYDAKGEEIVSIAIEVTGVTVTATTAGDTALAWAPAAITPVGAADAVTPVALVSGNLTALKAGTIVVK